MELPKEESIPILVVPFPAQGHLNQLLHFSLTLASHGFPVHFACSSVHNRQARDRIRGWSSESLHNITFHDIPIPSLPSNVPNPNSAHKFPSHILPVWDSVLRVIRSPLSSLLRSLSSSSPRLILVHDPLMSFVAHDAAAVPSVETYKFQCISALTQLSFIWESNGKASTEDNDILFSPLEDTITEGVQDFLNVYYIETPAEGIVLNTCRAIEGPFIDLLGKEDDFISKKMFAVGPISPVIVQSPQRHACLEWLDKQPPESVVYVAFGSTTTLSDEQVKEIAVGLERSTQRFIWVLRDADRGDVSSVEGEVNREKSLLTDFDERVEGVGMVVRGWAPQLDILAHPSTAAFMSHCGWNSCMEGMSMGLPILTWPMHSDQPRHALMITEYLKVGVMVRDWGKRNETTKGEEVEMAVKKVMVDEQGKEIRRRAKEMGESIRAATKEGGSSHEELEAFIAHITRRVE
ncbi:hypothetical protein J5N97_024096 [Dioscorea zingiberensis]|uniref:Glycosyltransferase n=1 Tax=Dioscorea zingiberensis TaxID=325984 RepID=A0A9D5C6H2_9LILI|nr:hypothetical protein J5N97_024096 [Dioscorea zingiberensis]